jgi:hypothetical protein
MTADPSVTEQVAEVLHPLTCPVRARWRRRRYSQPFWRDDKTAQMLGVADFGCPRCGHGAIAERDTTHPQPDRPGTDTPGGAPVSTNYTCPTRCVEKNHPGREHEEWTAEHLSFSERVRLRWWSLRAWLRRCPECGRRGYGTAAPRWTDDPVAKMLGVAHLGCPCCGNGVTS